MAIPARRVAAVSAPQRLLSPLLAVLSVLPLLALLLTIAGSDPAQAAAGPSELQLAQRIAYAHDALGIPDALLAPVSAQAAALTTASDSLMSAPAIEAQAARIEGQLRQVERLAPGILTAQTQGDLATDLSLLLERHAEGLLPSYAYQSRLAALAAALPRLTRPGDLARLDAQVRAQNAALLALLPAYRQWQAFEALQAALPVADLERATLAAEDAADQHALDTATTALGYTRLQALIGAQALQLAADEAAALPAAGQQVLAALGQRIALVAGVAPGVAAQARHALAADTLALPQARTPARVLALANAITQQATALTLPLLRAQDEQQLAALAQAIAVAQRRGIRDPFTGAWYPAAYEYASVPMGYGLVASAVRQADSADALLAARQAIAIQRTNLAAMLANMGDTTPYNRTHGTDLSLMAAYGLLSGKVVVVSLREQTVRFYDAGKLVYATYVTTGRPSRPSPPGLHYAMVRASPTVFVSSEPPGSPLWFAPTSINYAVLYFPGGYYLHDAWWRTEYGPGTNLPHYDPAAFNGGSHGCINFTKATAAWMYAWTPLGTPILIY